MCVYIHNALIGKFERAYLPVVLHTYIARAVNKLIQVSQGRIKENGEITGRNTSKRASCFMAITLYVLVRRPKHFSEVILMLKANHQAKYHMAAERRMRADHKLTSVSHLFFK